MRKGADLLNNGWIFVRCVVGHVSAAEKDSQKRHEFFAEMSDVMLAREFKIVPNTRRLA